MHRLRSSPFLRGGRWLDQHIEPSHWGYRHWCPACCSLKAEVERLTGIASRWERQERCSPAQQARWNATHPRPYTKSTPRAVSPSLSLAVPSDGTELVRTH